MTPTPVEKAMDMLINGASIKDAAESADMEVTQLNQFIERQMGKEALVMLQESRNAKEVRIDGGVYPVDRVTRKNQVLTARPSWYTGQPRNKFVPVAHCVLLPTIKVSDPPGYLTRLPHGYMIVHKNGDPADCRLSNLEMRTVSDHMRIVRKQRANTP